MIYEDYNEDYNEKRIMAIGNYRSPDNIAF